MIRLRRHQLAYLSAAGWHEVLSRPLAQPAAAQLASWAQRGLPLVVSRQGEDCVAGEVALGWPAPLACARLRMSVRLPEKAVAWLDEFPQARAALRLVPRCRRAGIEPALQALEQLGTRPRVYGSYGWQLITGLDYVHAASDLDLWLSVGDLRQADAAVEQLQTCGECGVRVDGELMFPGGVAVAWREYAAWRAGRTRTLLFKRLDSLELACELPLPAWCEEAVS
jgi:phosphoribosyl-dephospho-CoA transferase